MNKRVFKFEYSVFRYRQRMIPFTVKLPIEYFSEPFKIFWDIWVNSHEISIDEAAKILNVSNSFVQKLMDNMEIDFYLSDYGIKVYRLEIENYVKKQRKKSKKALAEMVRMNQEMGLYE